MDDLRVSVIIPTHNRAALVLRAVTSVLRIVEPGDEVLVVDDGSTDGTEAALAHYDGRIRYLRVPHGGAGAARNHGIRAARTPLVAFLDSDDEWAPDKLRLQRALLQQRPDVLFCFSDFSVRHESGRVTRRFLRNWHRGEQDWDAILGPGVWYSSRAALPPGRDDFRVHVGDLYLPQLRANHVFTSTLVVRREPAGAALRFAEDLPTFEDTECYARLAGAGLAAYLDCETAWQWGHRGHRLTHADEYVCGTTRLTILERIWGRDEAFLARHGDRYREAVAAQHRKRARWLLKEGRTREALAELRSAGGGPPTYHFLAALPGWLIPVPLIRRLRGARRALLGRGWL
ncbi:MAG TPA: glycosyltransferase family 2 protein [Thermomicrobiales bacterium]|nr:glycosyltransferase family 2 protein [Thermomicrobiales bacterium]